VSLYENASQWFNLHHKILHDMTIDEFRDMLGVENSKYEAFGDLNIHVIKPAVLEINALAPFNVSIHPVKIGRRVAGVKIGWWRKSTEELQEAWKEAQRPKVGRKARLTGSVVTVAAPVRSIGSQSRQFRLERRKSADF
jgi:plasmid replication initiation protein